MSYPVPNNRTVYLAQSAGFPATLRLPTKDPSDTVPAYLDCSAYLGDDTISGISSFSVVPIDMTVSSVQQVGNVIGMEISGGTAGSDYAIRIVFQTASGQTIGRTIWQNVQNLSPSGVYMPPSAYATFRAQLMSDPLFLTSIADASVAYIPTALGKPAGTLTLLGNVLAIPDPGP